MSKQKFLKELEKRLAILNEEEKEDTINEYRDIIEEKIKHGKTEEEAVKEFGSIDELTKEILSAYKINPEYQKNQEEVKDKTKDFVETTENLIKKGAKKISEVASEVADNVSKSDTFTTKNIIQIAFRIFFMLLGLVILKIPFSMVGEIGESILEIDFLPFSRLLQIVWQILIELVYIIVCILIVITFVKKYWNFSTDEEIIQNKKTKQNQIANKVNEKREIMSKTFDKSILITFLKICVCLFILFPILCVNLGLILAMAIVIYFIFNGVSMISILLTLLGILIISFGFCHMIYNLLFLGEKYHFISLVIGFVITIIGLVGTINYFMGFTFYNELPSDKFKTKTITYEETITVPTNIIHGNLDIIIDPSLSDNQVRIDVTYYDVEGVTIKKRMYSYDDTENNIGFYVNHQDRSFNWNRDINDKLIEQLKSKEIYNYELLDQVKVRVYVNEKTKSLIN